MNSNIKKQPTKQVPNSATSIFGMNKYGADLEIRLCEPSRLALTNYKEGNVDLGVIALDGIGFVLSKFGSERWTAAPFHVSQSPSECRGIAPEFSEASDPAKIYVLLCDEHGYQEFGGRCVSMSRQVISEIAALAKSQMVKPITKQRFVARVQLAKWKFTPRQMAALSSVPASPGHLAERR